MPETSLSMTSSQDETEIRSFPTLWRNKQFLILLLSYSVSLFGNTFHNIALNLWVLQMTGSAKMMAVVVVTNLLLSSLLGSIAGTYTDRLNRRSIMLVTDLISFVLVLVIAYCVSFSTTPFVLIVILTGLVTTSALFQSPAYQASLVNIVGKEDLQRAFGLMNLSENICRTVGFALGGIFVAAFGVSFAIMFDGMTFLVSFILVLLAGTFPSPRIKALQQEKPKFIDDLITGIRYIWKDPFARSVIIMLPTLTLFFMPSLMLTQVMAITVWEANPFQFGLMEACIPLGYMLGSGFIVFGSSRIKHRGKWIMLNLLLIGPMYIILSFASSAVAAIPTILIIGFMYSFCTLLITIILRTEVSEELQGRVFGVLGSIMSVAPSIGLAISSYYADIYSSNTVMFVIGGLLLLFGIAAFIKLKVISRYR